MSLIGKAAARGDIRVNLHNLRNWSHDVHHSVDDAPYGGGPGMVMKAGPWGEALDAVAAADPGVAPRMVVPTPSGALFTQQVAARYAREPRLLFACGRYEGIDARVIDEARTRMPVDEVSIGDYVLAGGEAAVLVMVEAICRLVPGVLGNAESVADDSFGGCGVPASYLSLAPAPAPAPTPAPARARPRPRLRPRSRSRLRSRPRLPPRLPRPAQLRPGCLRRRQLRPGPPRQLRLPRRLCPRLGIRPRCRRRVRPGKRPDPGCWPGARRRRAAWRGCSRARSTRNRESGADAMCQLCCSPGIMRRLRGGGAMPHCGGPRRCVRNLSECSILPGSMTGTVRCCLRLAFRCAPKMWHTESRRPAG